ncbi:hypothetical protein GCM10011503_28640 [Henriciella pelagia]|uniref:Uncharacterized protein n=1 Tax=Henriciella pelagia TaxID=1977912 RepID=A0ABQ1JU62_9PROT|nr:hypothetical protein GCM10011503_28640 [Henriciella pelagia]
MAGLDQRGEHINGNIRASHEGNAERVSHVAGSSEAGGLGKMEAGQSQGLQMIVNIEWALQTGSGCSSDRIPGP